VLAAARDGGDGVVIGLFILALSFPAIQLVCAVVVALWLGVSTRHDKPYQLRQLGKITLGLVVGTVAGIMSMVGIGVVMSAL
jgi:hypothetical protein